MHQVRDIRTSLEVGFLDGNLPPKFVGLRGRLTRAIPCSPEFPFEDGQFEIVMMDGSVVSAASVREAHRVLKPDGELHFIVPEKSGGSDGGFTLPDIYAIVRSGFNITGLELPKWWHFGKRARVFTVCARKKNWRATTGTFRPLV